MPEPIAASDLDLDIATRTLFGECRGEPNYGQCAVAWVIRNRAMWRPAQWWGDTIIHVCLHRQQFSCWNLDDPNYELLHALDRSNPAYGLLRKVASDVFGGAIEDMTKGATSYEVVGTNAPWTKGRSPTVTIGHHEFFVIPPGG